METGELFYYFGDDEGYFRTLQGEFQRHTKLKITFKRIYESDEASIQSLILKVYLERPSVVFIDFSKHTQDYLHLARLMARTPLEHKVTTVGLVDYLSSPDIHYESVATGTHFTHIKSPETFDVVYDVTKLMAPQEIGEHGFATAALSDEWEAGVPAKVGFIDPAGIHVETNFKISKGNKLKIKHHWQDKRIVSSGEVFVREVSPKDLFYNFSLGADLEFLFVDDFLPPDGMEPERIKEKIDEREEMIRHHQKLLEKWIDDNRDRSCPKSGKLLVVDRELTFYQDQTRSDKHPYIIRSIPFLENISEELDRLHPQVIAFVMDSPGQGTQRNNQQSLLKLAQTIKSQYKELNPFIVVFNSPMPSKEMQEVLDYTNVMATTNPLSSELLVKMADLYEKKRMGGETVGTKNVSENIVYLKKTNIASHCEFLISVKVIKLSETDMVFECEHELPPGANLHMHVPVEMHVHALPIKGQSKLPQYHGLIHCLGEAQKKELRRFVNSVFFREHDAAAKTDTLEFQRLNEAKLQDKIAQAALKVQEQLKMKEKAAKKAAKKEPEAPDTEED